MKNSIIHKIKEAWEDLTKPTPYLHGTTCCSYDPTPFKPRLKPEPIPIENRFNNKNSKL